MVDDKLLQEVKTYIRMTDYGDEEIDKQIDNEIKTYIIGAEVFLKSHGVKYNYENELYKIAIFMLVSTWYDSKGGLVEQAREIPFGVTRIIRQLNILGDYGTV